MTLTLEVISYMGAPPASPLRASIGKSGGSVGRSPDNNLPLPDHDKIISRRHGSIHYANGAFVYTDASTGGTGLCNQNRQLEKDESIVLADGDRLKIGEYELLVRIESGEPSAPSYFDPVLDLENPKLFEDRSLESGLDLKSLLGDREPIPVLAQDAYPPRPAAIKNDSFISQPDAPPFQENFTLPDVQENSENFGNLFGDLPAAVQAVAAKPDELDFFGNLFGDWGLDTNVSSAPAPLPGPPKQHDVLEPIAETPAPVISIPQPGRPAAPAKVPAIVSPTFDHSHPSFPPSREGVNPSALPSASPPDVRAVPPSPVPEDATGADLLQCFLEGAGLTESLATMTQDEQIKTMRSVGQVYREMVDGMMKVLHARKMEQSMIALRQTDVTQFRRGECNPLKIFPTAEETMAEMVLQKNPAYIGPAAAVREGFADIMNHQMAMRAGMQAAMSGFLKRVDPKSFEEMFKDGIMFQKKAKCWDTYSKTYPKLVEETMDDLFGETFAEAYREQLRILRLSQQAKD